MNNVYDWQFNTIPGNANQGAVLFTRNNITQPPFNQDDFIWKAMEDIIGVANMKLDYDIENNEYTLMKASGHLDNDGEWHYSWEEVGKFSALTDAVKEALENMEYVSYRFDTTTTVGELYIYGVKKDGTEVELVHFSIPDDEWMNYIQTKLEGLIDDSLTTSAEHTWSIDKIKAYVGENGFQYKGQVPDISALPANPHSGDIYSVYNEGDFYVAIDISGLLTWVPFTAVKEHDSDSVVRLDKTQEGLKASLKYNDQDFTTETSTVEGVKLKANLIQDTWDASIAGANKKTWSIVKIASFIAGGVRYMGQVQHYSDLLAITSKQAGDLYNVIDTGFNYVWDEVGQDWDALGGEYTPGDGIDITGRVITVKKSDGLSFDNNDNLKVNTTNTTKIDNNNNVVVNYNEGLGENTSGQLKVNIGQGLELNSTDNSVKVKPDNKAIILNTNDEVAVKADDGIKVDNTKGIILNTNLSAQSTALGSDFSGLAKYADGKVGVDFSNIKMTQTLLGRFRCGDNTNRITNITVPNMADYDIFIIQPLTNLLNTSQAGIQPIMSAILAKQTGVLGSYYITGISPEYGYGGATAPAGAGIYGYRFENINFASGTIGDFQIWKMYQLTNTVVSWTAYTGYSDSEGWKMGGFAIYGLKMSGN